MANRPLTIFE